MTKPDFIKLAKQIQSTSEFDASFIICDLWHDAFYAGKIEGIEQLGASFRKAVLK